MKNNITLIRIVNKLLPLFLLLLVGLSTSAQVRKPFLQRTSSFTPTRAIYSVNGDFTMIGNTNMTLQNYSTSAINSNNIMVKVDADADAATNNSSSANLNFSQENGANTACSQVVFAGLYWTARTDDNPTELEKRTVKFRGPGQTNYTTYTATANDIYYPGDGNMYASFTEVTSQVQQCGQGEYWLADMALTTGNGGPTGYYGGWGLVVVYENSQMKKRDITVFDGYAYVIGGTAQWELPVSGFNTVLSGGVNTKLGLMAGEGDVGISGDKFEIQKQTSPDWLILNHASNQQTNFFNSTILTGGNTRNPDLENNTGMDISMFTIPNANNEVITNGQTSTTFRYSSTQDTYIIFSICMAVDAYEPLIEGFLSLSNVNGTSTSSTSAITVLPGDQIQYKVQIRNKGNEPVNNVRLEIPLPYAAITYVGSSVNVYPPAATTSVPFVDANAGANGTLIWDFGTLPVPSNPDNVLGEVVFTLEVSEDCDLFRNYNCAAPEVEINGNISGIGANTGIEVEEQPFYVGFSQSGGCGSEPLLGPLKINIDSFDWVSLNCAEGDSIRDFFFCNRTTPIPLMDIVGFYPAGTRFFDSTLTVEYTINNPFPNQAGPVLYRAVLQSNCILSFSLAIINTVINSTPTITSLNLEYCQGAQAAALTATPSDPSYNLYYFAPGSTIAQPLLIPSTLNAGAFIYQVAEGPSASCISTARADIPVLINPAPVIATTVTQIPCFGSFGSIVVSVSGGTGNLTADPNNSITNNLSAGSYSYTYTDAIGCSSTTTVVINEEPEQPEQPELKCYETASWNSNSCQWDIAGNPPSPTTVNARICNGESYVLPDGIVVLQAGTYVSHLVTETGCDSIVTTILQLNPTYNLTEQVFICTNSPYVLPNGQSVSNSGIYISYLNTIEGCDSIITTEVRLYPAVSVTIDANSWICGEGYALNATAVGGTAPFYFLWSNGQTSNYINNLYTGNYTVTVTDANGCSATATRTLNAPAPFRTQTQGGWGADPSGNNPGTYLANNFAAAFPAPSYLMVGCTRRLQLTSAAAVNAFLPSSGTSKALPAGTTINPGPVLKNTFAGQVVTLTLNVTFDNYDPSFGLVGYPLRDLRVANGTFAGWTVQQVLVESNKKLGGCSSPYTFSQLNDVCSMINQNFDNGTYYGNGLICVPAPQAPVRMMQSEATDVHVYPNPNEGSFTTSFEILESSKVELILTDLSGKVLRALERNLEPGLYEDSELCNGLELKAGIYLVRFREGDKPATTTKVIVTNP